MKSKDGKRTGEFGLWLTQNLSMNSHYSVFYDHGDKQKSPMVAAIKGFFDHKVENKNRLTDVDVIVVNNDNDEVILLIEIEESEMSPKKLLGDVFATVMCNRFAVKIENENRNFEVSPRTRLIIAGFVSNRNSMQNKISNIIMPRLKRFNLPDDAIQVDKIKIVIGKDISETLEKLKNEMKNLFTMG